MTRSAAKKFVIYSTLFMIFGSDFWILAGGITIQAFYPLIFVNLFLIMLLQRLWLPVQLLYVFAALAASGCIGLYQGTDTVTLFAKQAIGIMMCLAYFCCFFRLVDFDFPWIFREYARFAWYIVIYGLVVLPVQYYFDPINDGRLRSILSEPTAFAAVCLPAYFYYAHLWQQNRTGGKRLAIFTLAFLLSGSSNAYLAMFLGMILFSRRYKMGPLVSIPLVAAVALLTYTFSQDFEERFDDTVSSIVNKDVGSANLSSLALYSNFFVTEEVVKRHPLFGNGLGSHGKSYDRYAYNLDGLDRMIGTPLERLNADDANSLLLRTSSELGLVGAGFILFSIWYFRPRKKNELSYMCEGILLYFFIKLFRGGHYFQNEQYFFVLIYFLRPFYLRLQGGSRSVVPQIEAPPTDLQLAPSL